MKPVHESLARHDDEHYYLPLNHPEVLACVWCGVSEDKPVDRDERDARRIVTHPALDETPGRRGRGTR